MKNETLLDIACEKKRKQLEATFLKEWSTEQFTKMQRLITRHFNDKLIRTLHGNHCPMVRNFEALGEIMGFAYTSSGEFAGYWVCNTDIYNEIHLNYHYVGFALSTDGKGYGIIKNEQEEELIIRL